MPCEAVLFLVWAIKQLLPIEKQLLHSFICYVLWKCLGCNRAPGLICAKPSMDNEKGREFAVTVLEN